MPEATGGRDAIRDALLRPSRSQIVVGILLAALGFGMVTQVRSTATDDSYAGQREQALIEMLSGLTGTSERARREIARLEEARRQLKTDTSARESAIDLATQRAESLSILAGLVPVTGPGIRVKVVEQEKPMSAESLLDAVQELRTAGAEAMQINGKVRLVAQSSFTQVVGGVVVDGTLLTSPYELDAIGAPHTLSSALSFPDGPTSAWQEEGCQVTIDLLSSVDIAAVREPERPVYATEDSGQ